MIPNTAMHWHYEVFALKGLLIYIHTYTWGHLLTLLNPGDSEVVKYNILSKMCDTIEFLFKKYLQVQICCI